MNPAIPQLDPVPLPAPVALLWFLLLLTFTLHVLPMNLVLGGSILGAVARWRAARGQAHDAELVRWIGKAMPILISAAVTTGVAALLFLQVLYGRLFFVSSVLMAFLWLAVVPLLILAYYSAYVIAFRGGSAPAWWSWGVATILLAVGFIYSNNMSLMLRPAAFRDMYLASARGFHLNLADPTLLPRFLHVVTGAMAVSSLAIAALGVARRRADPVFGGWAVQYGCTWFAAATIFNIVFGIWYLASLPSYALRPLVGEDLPGTALLAAGILGGAVSLAFVMAAAQSRRPGRALGGAAGSLTITIVLMILTRDFVRRTMATAAGFEWPQWVAPQWWPVALFAALLAGGIALIGWMAVTFVKSGARPVDVVASGSATRSIRPFH
jgi:hypothetical protein